MGDTANMEIKGVSWNIQHLGGRIKDILPLILSEWDIDVLLLQSVNCKKNDMPIIEGWMLAEVAYRKYTKSKTRLVDTCIYIRSNLEYYKAKSPIPIQENMSSCAIRVKINDNLSTTYINVYYPTGIAKYDYSYLTTLKSTPGHDYIIGGDFNHHSAAWSAQTNALPVDNVARATMDYDMHVCNDGSVTRPATVAGREGTAIDLLLVSSGLIHKYHWQVLSEYLLTSDHLPLLISISHGTNIHVQKHEPKYNYAKADWPAFAENLSYITSRDVESSDENVYYTNITAKCLQAANKSIPMTKQFSMADGKKRVKWWNERCHEAYKKLKKSSALITRIRTTENLDQHEKAKQYFKEVCCAAKLNQWQTFLDKNVKDHFDSGKMWRKVKKEQNKGKTKHSFVLKYDNKTYLSDKEKADLLCERIAHNSQNKCLLPEEKTFRQHFEDKYQDPTEDNTLDVNKPFSIEEVRAALQSINDVNKAPGEDKLSYQMLQHLPDNMLLIFTDFFNFCYTKGKMPDAWKAATVFALHKTGKPVESPDSYRPISLTPHTSKWFERVINMRLTHYLNQNNIIPHNQSGFRRFRSVTDNLVYLSEKFKQTIQGRRNTTYATFFDLKRAFDRVWHTKLLSKLKLIGLSGRIYGIIKDFLDNRSMQVKVGSQVSAVQFLDMGTPQGAVLSPTLFAIMLFDINKYALKDTEFLLYADDIAIISKRFCFKDNMAKKQNSIIKQHQRAINRLTEYMFLNGFVFSAEKTQFLIVSRLKLARTNKNNFISIKSNPRNYDEEPTIIHPSETIKYLGVTFDSKLLWLPHIRNLVKKATLSTNLIRILAATPWAKGSAFLVNVCKALIRSVLSFGQELFFGAKPSHLALLDQAEKRALRAALSLPRTASGEKLYEETHLLRLGEERRLRCAQYIIRTKALPDHINNIYFNEDKGHMGNVTADKLMRCESTDLYVRALPLWSYVIYLIKGANIPLCRIENFVTPDVAPWLILKPAFKSSLPTGFTKSDNLRLAGMYANEYIENNYKDFYQVYTDGSVQRDGRTASAVVAKAPDGNGYKYIGSHHNKNLSTFSTEIYALYTAVKSVCEGAVPYDKIVFLTDSLSSIQALQSPPNQRFALQNEIKTKISHLILNGKTVELCYVPSHTSPTIPGNDKADKLANAITADTTSNIPTADIGYTRKEAYALFNNHIKKDNLLFESYSLPGFKNGIYPKLIPNYVILIRKLRTKSCAFKWLDIRCKCGKKVTLEHLFDNCQTLKETSTKLNKYLSDNDFTTEDLLKEGKLGWAPSKFLCDAIVSCPMAHAFF